VLAY